MKRALVVLLALVLGAGLLFAADPAKWGAWIEGDLVFYDQAGNYGITPNWVGTGQYSTLSLSYAEDVFGFSMTSEFGSTAWGAGLRNMSAWYSMFNKMVKFTAGKARVGDYRPTSFVEGTAAYARIANAEWGLLTQVMPVAGASVGAFVELPEGMAAQNYVNSLNFAASYEMKDLGKLCLQWRLNKQDEIGVGLKVDAVKVLPIVLTYNMNLTTSKHTVLASAQYAADAITVAVDAVLGYDTAATWAVEAMASYKLSDMWSVGANIGYDAGYGFWTDGDGVGGFIAYPWVNANVGSGSLKLGFVFDTEYAAEGTNWKIPLKYVIAF